MISIGSDELSVCSIISVEISIGIDIIVLIMCDSIRFSQLLWIVVRMFSGMLIRNDRQIVVSEILIEVCVL